MDIDWESASLEDLEFLQTTGISRVFALILDWRCNKVRAGTGRYGRVRLAKHKHSGKFVAVKVCPRAKLSRDDQIRHAVSERRVLMTVQHPFIVKLYFFSRCGD